MYPDGAFMLTIILVFMRLVLQLTICVGPDGYFSNFDHMAGHTWRHPESYTVVCVGKGPQRSWPFYLLQLRHLMRAVHQTELLW